MIKNILTIPLAYWALSAGGCLAGGCMSTGNGWKMTVGTGGFSVGYQNLPLLEGQQAPTFTQSFDPAYKDIVTKIVESAMKEEPNGSVASETP